MSVLGFWGCSKETVFDPSVSSTEKKPYRHNVNLPNPITIQEAKSWFESKYGAKHTIGGALSVDGKKNASPTQEDKYYFNEMMEVQPLWSSSKISSYLKKYPILIVPVKPIPILDSKGHGYKLIFFRDSTGKCNARLQVYRGVDSYLQKNDRPSVLNFSGIFYQIDMSGLGQRLLIAEKGKLIDRIILPENPASNDNKLKTRTECDCFHAGSGESIWEEAWCLIKCSFRTIANVVQQDAPPNETGGGSQGGLPISYDFGFTPNPIGSFSPDDQGGIGSAGGGSTSSGGSNTYTGGTNGANDQGTNSDGSVNQFFDDSILEVEWKLEQKYLPFLSIEVYNDLRNNPALFAQVDGFLNENGFTPENVQLVKIFIDNTGDEPYFQIDGQEYTAKQMVYADRIVRSIFNKNRNNVDIRSEIETKLNDFIQTDLGKKMLFPDGLWNPERYNIYKKLLTNIWEDHFEASVVSLPFYDSWYSKIVNAPTNVETAYYMQQRGQAARSELSQFSDLVIESIVEIASMMGSFRPTLFNTEGKVLKLNYAPSRGSLEIEPNGVFSQSERKAAEYMSNLGKNVKLRQPVGQRFVDGRTSDLDVDGVTYDVLTPITNNPAQILSAIAAKNTQARGIVVDLSKSGVEPAALGDVMKRVKGFLTSWGQPHNIQKIYIINTNNF